MKPYIDFDIKSDLYWIRVADYSVWDLIENKISIIEITLPGYSNPVTLEFDKYKSNGFNSHNLGVSCKEECGEVILIPLPDGIYTIQVKGSPSKFNKKMYYLKTDQFDLDYSRIVVDSFNNKCYEDIDDMLTEVDILKRGAESHTTFGLIKEASHIFKLAQDKINKLKNCGCVSL